MAILAERLDTYHPRRRRRVTASTRRHELITSTSVDTYMYGGGPNRGTCASASGLGDFRLYPLRHGSFAATYYGVLVGSQALLRGPPRP